MAISKYISDVPFSSKETEVTPYINSFDISSQTIDFQTLDEYKSSEYTLSAENLKGAYNKVNAIQEYWGDNVIGTLDENQRLLNSWIENMAHSPNGDYEEYDSSKTYNKNNIVIYDDDGAFYLSLKDNNTDDISISSSWFRIYMRGNKGQAVAYLNYRGVWIPNEEYDSPHIIDGVVYFADCVWYAVGRNINFYVCETPVQSETPPNQDSTHWHLLLSKPLDTMQIYDTMPNQAFFNNPTSPSVFGVVNNQGVPTGVDINCVDIIDRIHTTDINNPVYLMLRSNGVASGLDNIINNLIQEYNI